MLTDKERRLQLRVTKLREALVQVKTTINYAIDKVNPEEYATHIDWQALADQINEALEDEQ